MQQTHAKRKVGGKHNRKFERRSRNRQPHTAASSFRLCGCLLYTLEVKKAGKEQIKEKARESIREKLAKGRLNADRDNRERWEREGRIAPKKKHDMEL